MMKSALLAALLTALVVVSNAAAVAVCVRENADQCGFLMKMMMTSSAALPPHHDCDCYDFCNGLLVGCGGGANQREDNPDVAGCFQDSERVRGCTKDDVLVLEQEQEQQAQQQQEERSLQTTVIGPPLPPCPAGQFRRGTGAPCVNCLRCAYNAIARVNCVAHAANPAQCECNPGLVTNGRGGCLVPPSTIGGGSLDGGGRPCTGCGFNSSPVPGVYCITNAADPRQCQCNPGYVSNGRGGCDRTYPTIVAPVPVPRPVPVPAPFPIASTTIGVITECSPGMTLVPGRGCVTCQDCAWYARPLVTCVTNRADMRQCECQRGYTLNVQGECLLVTTTIIPPGGGGGSGGGIGSGSLVDDGAYRCDRLGYCRMGYGQPCLLRQSCGPNGAPLLPCVHNNADENQCRCQDGYRMNMGACVRVGGGSVTPGDGGGGGLPPCPAGQYRRGNECANCGRCPWNASPLVTCVEFSGDPAQCRCNPGYESNFRGGCRISSGSTTSMEALESAAAAASHQYPLGAAWATVGGWLFATFMHLLW